jgi:hypothetical protein
MSAKTGAARREAFFAALAATGNRTLAAERAKVSQSWVTLHRAQDPAFRARMEVAVAEAKARLAEAAVAAPPSGWGSLDGEELVVRGTNGRRVQIARARLKQWTPRVEARFLTVLAATCNVKAACAEVGLTQASAYNHARRWRGFLERWDAALATGYARLEIGLVERGCNLFSPDEAPLGSESGAMDVEQAMRLLRMHRRRLFGEGEAPGCRRRIKTFDEVAPGIRRMVEAIKRAERLSRDERKRDEREWAQRRKRTGPGE